MDYLHILLTSSKSVRNRSGSWKRVKVTFIKHKADKSKAVSVWLILVSRPTSCHLVVSTKGREVTPLSTVKNKDLNAISYLSPER